MNFFRKLAGGIGDVAKFAAPALTFIPGVGPVAAAAAGAAGGALGTLNDERGTNLGRAMKSAAGYGAGTYAGSRMIGGTGGSSPSNVGAALENLLNNGGDAVDYLTDKDRGAARTALVTGLGQLGLGAYAGNQAGRAEEEQQAYNRRNDPMREKIMQMFLDRFNAAPRVAV